MIFVEKEHVDDPSMDKVLGKIIVADFGKVRETVDCGLTTGNASNTSMYVETDSKGPVV